MTSATASNNVHPSQPGARRRSGTRNAKRSPNGANGRAAAPPSPPPLPGLKFESLAATAHSPNVDPCDVACDAMPAHIVGDLGVGDECWLKHHTEDCDYCATILHRYEHLDTLLEELDQIIERQATPPPLHLVIGPVVGRSCTLGEMASPVGVLRLAVSDKGVCEVGFEASESEAEFRARLNDRGLKPNLETDLESSPLGAPVVHQLQEYFNRQRTQFDVPLDMDGISPFTKVVLKATATVPFGQLSTYGAIAAEIGKPKAGRAVGNALGRNPIPIIVPCHRIVRSDSSIGGYTGGLQIKEKLLDLEGVTLGLS